MTMQVTPGQVSTAANVATNQADNNNSNKVLQTALAAIKHGVSIVPVRADGSKRPALSAWKEFQERLPSEKEIRNWYSNRFGYGLAVLGGTVSGNLEFLDFDNQEYFELYLEAAKQAGIAHIVEKVRAGYCEQTPNGFHLLYRCKDAVSGNQKLAQIKLSDGKPKAVIETRGEGGYAIVAPSGGSVHPSGKPYQLLNGDLSKVAVITAEERNDLLRLARCFSEVEERPEKAPVTGQQSGALNSNSNSDELRPGDDFNARASWNEILIPHGWKPVHSHGDKTTWRRPGKNEGISATTGYNGTDYLYVFSSSTEFETERGYSKFSAYAILNHGGDFQAATRELQAKGYGTQHESFEMDFTGFAGAKLDERTGKVVERKKSERPRLSVQIADLHELNPLIWEALKDYNTPPHLFRYAGRLQRFQVDGDKWRLEELNENIMRFEITEAIEWYKVRDTREGPEEVQAVPPRHIPQNLLADSNPQLPNLIRVVETPVFTKDGELIASPGYHDSGILYHPSYGLYVPPVSERPDQEEIEQAKALINELLCDFPFTNDGERTNALSIFFDPYMREMVKGATPLRMIEASTPGSGKGLLADVLTRHATGQPGLITQCQTEEEWNKSLISQLKANVAVIQIDNISTSLDSGSLAAALTSEYYGGRLLGTNDTVQWPNRAIWIATANNPTMTTEIARRTVRIRLNPKQDRPWQREGFKHNDLRLWAEENRGQLVWAALTLIKAWINVGMPKGSNKPLGSFEHWSRLLGGLLEFCGFEGFLSNLNEFYESADQEGAVLRSFIKLWWETYGDQKVTVSDLFKLTEDFTDFDLGKGSERSQRTVFGKLVSRQRDRVISDYVIKSAGSRQGVSIWQLQFTSQAMF